MNVPATMRAIDPEKPGGPEVLVLVERPVPAPGAGEVLIRVAAAGVNRPEVMQRMGVYPPPPGAPSILGMEVSGMIVAVGEDVPIELLGQPVCALISGGAYAEYAVAPAGQCLPVPHALTMIEAAAMPETLFTVWTNLFERGYRGGGRYGARPRRHQRHRHDGDRAGQPVRPDDHRHLRLRRRNAPLR